MSDDTECTDSFRPVSHRKKDFWVWGRQTEKDASSIFHLPLHHHQPLPHMLFWGFTFLLFCKNVFCSKRYTNKNWIESSEQSADLRRGWGESLPGQDVEEWIEGSDSDLSVSSRSWIAFKNFFYNSKQLHNICHQCWRLNKLWITEDPEGSYGMNQSGPVSSSP